MNYSVPHRVDFNFSGNCQFLRRLIIEVMLSVIKIILVQKKDFLNILHVFCRMWLYITILGILLCTHLTNNVEAKSKKSKSVTTLLEAKWEVTPLVLEVAEYLADENVDFYWSFIDSISSLSPPLVEIGRY